MSEIYFLSAVFYLLAWCQMFFAMFMMFPLILWIHRRKWIINDINTVTRVYTLVGVSLIYGGVSYLFALAASLFTQAVVAAHPSPFFIPTVFFYLPSLVGIGVALVLLLFLNFLTPLTNRSRSL